MIAAANALAPHAAPARAGAYEKTLGFIVFAMMASGSISFIEPSPYDFISMAAILTWFAGNPRLHRSLVLILMLWIIYNIVGFASVLPYWEEAEPRLYQLQSLYLFVTVFFFTVYFSENTLERFHSAMKGFVAGALFAGLVAIAGYMNIAGLGEFATMYEGRANGTFKDPNVLGSYMIMATIYVSARLMLGEARSILLSILGLCICLAATFLSFSRGSWGATVMALTMLTGFAFATTRDMRLRRRIVIIVAAVVAVAVIGLLLIATDPATLELLTMRASATQDYDVGETGRFGNQLRAIQTLLGLPFGFGPLRLRLTFGLDPHNSYIGAFANYGWLGGFLWLAICLATAFVGIRMMSKLSPYRHAALAIVPSMFALLMQGFQIDVDHWRQFYPCIGAVWGLEAARRQWLSQQPAAPTQGAAQAP